MCETYGNISTGRKTVTAAGTPETLVSARTPARRIHIRAIPTNTKPVAIGDSLVDAAVGAQRGVMLAVADPALVISQDDLQRIYVDAEVNGEGVTFTYEW